jgi:hypothetical protein
MGAQASPHLSYLLVEVKKALYVCLITPKAGSRGYQRGMAQIITALLYLYCGSGCKASVVASALTFHPPPPYYKFEAADEDGRDKEGQPLKLEKRRYRLRLSPELPSIPSDVVSRYSCHTIVSNTGTVVPLVLFEQHDAYFTIIVSHGNASDIGSMFIFYAML